MTYDSRTETYEHIGLVRRNPMVMVKELLDRADGHDASKLVDPERAIRSGSATTIRVKAILHNTVDLLVGDS